MWYYPRDFLSCFHFAKIRHFCDICKFFPKKHTEVPVPMTTTGMRGLIKIPSQRDAAREILYGSLCVTEVPDPNVSSLVLLLAVAVGGIAVGIVLRARAVAGGHAGSYGHGAWGVAVFDSAYIRTKA